MNFYKLARYLDDFIEECQEGAKDYPELGGHIDCLDPFTEVLHKYPWILEDKSPNYMDSTDYRVDIFETDLGDLVWAFYSPQAEATSSEVQNSHASLANVLMEHYVLNFSKRWCGFYSRITGNGNDDFLILYGMSSDYPHNEHSKEVVKRFVKKIFLTPFPPTRILVMDDEHIMSYTKDSDDLPF